MISLSMQTYVIYEFLPFCGYSHDLKKSIRYGVEILIFELMNVGGPAYNVCIGIVRI